MSSVPRALLTVASVFALVGACSEVPPETSTTSSTGSLTGATNSSGGVTVSSSASDSSSSSSASSSGAGGSGGQGGQGGTSASGGNSSQGGGPGCIQADPESNDTDGTAVDLGTLEDCNPDPLPVLKGTLSDSADVDWYTYDATDEGTCLIDATRTLTAGSGMRVCKFADCVTGTTSVVCTDQAQEVASPFAGCCKDGGNFSMDVDCSGTLSDDATMYIRLDNATGTCVDYILQYHY